VEEKLLACRENKLGAAIDALENSVGKLHGRLPHRQGSSLKSAMTWGRLAGPVSLSSYVFLLPGPGPQQVQRQIDSSSQRTRKLSINLPRKLRAMRLSRMNEQMNRDRPLLVYGCRPATLAFEAARVAGAAHVTMGY
jgi:hypothetical protein